MYQLKMGSCHAANTSQMLHVRNIYPAISPSTWPFCTQKMMFLFFNSKLCPRSHFHARNKNPTLLLSVPYTTKFPSLHFCRLMSLCKNKLKIIHGSNLRLFFSSTFSLLFVPAIYIFVHMFFSLMLEYIFWYLDLLRNGGWEK